MILQAKEFVLILLALVLVAAIGVSSTMLNKKIENDTRTDLQNVLNAKLNSSHQTVKNWLNEQRAATRVWANTQEVRKAAHDLLATHQQELVKATAQIKLRNWLHPVHTGKGYYGYFIISPDLINLASSRDQNIGVKNLLSEQKHFFERIQAGHTAVSSPIESDVALPSKDGQLKSQQPTMFVGAPILDEQGKPIAFFTFRLNYASVFSNILQQGFIGESAEIYAFDKSGHLISESRFEQQLRDIGLLAERQSSILNIHITDPGTDLTVEHHTDAKHTHSQLNHMASQATQGLSGVDLDGYRDYRGVKVVGAWLWDDDLNFGIASELDYNEAYATLATARMTIRILTALAMLLTLLLTYIYYIYQQRKQIAQALHDSNQYNRMLFEESASGLALCRMNGELVDVNQSYADILGRSIDDTKTLTYWEITPEKYAEEEQAQLESLRKTGRYGPYKKEYIHKNGHFVDVELKGQILEKDGEQFIWSSAEDITQRRQAEDELRKAASVFDSTDEGIIVTDTEQNIIAINKAFTDITGYQRDEALGKNPNFQQSGRHDSIFYDTMWRTINNTGQWRGEIWNRRKSGEIYPVWENISAVRDDQGHLINYVSVFTDITTLKESEAKLEHIAHHDNLTGLPNRLMFTANLDQAVEHAQRHGSILAVLFLDLDRFKFINDSMGHDIGDKLLQAVALRLQDSVRSEDTVARFGGDEFTVILYEISSETDAASIAESIINIIAEPLHVNNHEIQTSTSVGISLFPRDADNAQDLLKAADTAMYHAKECGRNNYQFYTDELTQKSLQFHATETLLKKSLEQDQLVLYYQPQIDLHSGEVIGLEALLRWQHPQRGLLLPDEFIPVAEESSLIDQIGEWVLRQAFTDIRSWQQPGIVPVRVAINVSPRQLSSQHKINKLNQVLQSLEYQLQTLNIELEITESVLELDQISINAIRQLKQHHIMLAIDDFGSGHSSLSRLRDLPIDTIKIDKAFIDSVPDNADAKAIVSAIIAMAHSLNLNVIAEGVENQEQLLFLCEQGCDEMQGFLFSQAVPAAQIPELLQQVQSHQCQ